ncbi:hypothetical protein P9239_04450 [Caballeronia sp. LZ062]|uniref:hypothetical protein n=1 Tax=unclassified Caballeronia TaxID=2646786 RepID=UPI00285ECF43|nr:MULTISPECIES: hypothetical protein [unclassified Caballeronia]MDR5856996.1 hypothetical protein [Caballeronia sp. LZ050]MDR5869607.1 hypothetical protein [Caballeronia sp. LZ062]
MLSVWPKLGAGVTVALLAIASFSTPAAPVQIDLRAPTGFTAVSIDPVRNDQFCITGDLTSDDGESRTAWVTLVDVVPKQVAWAQRLPAPGQYIGNSAVRCATDGHSYFVLTQAYTHWESTLNQTKVFINQLSPKGELGISTLVSAGFDEWATALNVSPEAISVIGGANSALDSQGRFSMYVQQFDAKLKLTHSMTIPHGAFAPNSEASLQQESLRIAGEFLPDTVANAAGRQAFAFSDVDLRTGRYSWSTYVSPAKTKSEKSFFASDGSDLYVGLTPDDMTVAVVNANGEVAQTFSTAKPVCEVKAIGSSGDTLYLLGAACNQEATGELISIDLKHRTTKVVRELPGYLLVARFTDSGWAAVVKQKGGMLSLMHDSF